MTAFPALFTAFSRTKKKAGERHWRFYATMSIHSSTQCELPQGFAGFED